MRICGWRSSLSHRFASTLMFAIVWWNFGWRGDDHTWEDAEIHEDLHSYWQKFDTILDEEEKLIPEKMQKSMSKRRLPPSTPPLDPRSSGFWHSRSRRDWKEMTYSQDWRRREGEGTSPGTRRYPSRNKSIHSIIRNWTSRRLHLVESFFRHKDSACTLLTTREKTIPDVFMKHLHLNSQNRVGHNL